MTPHEARHCAASYLIEAGLNDLELTSTIGQSDPRTWGDVRIALRSEGAGSSAVGVLDLVVEIGGRAERIAVVSTCLEGP